MTAELLSAPEKRPPADRWTGVKAARLLRVEVRDLLRSRGICGQYVTPYSVCADQLGHDGEHGRPA